MNKLVLTAALFAAVAGSASASEVRVHLAGKSPAAAHAEIIKAADTVCREDVRGESLAPYLYASCLRASVREAVNKSGDPQLVTYSKTAGGRFAVTR